MQKGRLLKRITGLVMAASLAAGMGMAGLSLPVRAAEEMPAIDAPSANTAIEDVEISIDTNEEIISETAKNSSAVFNSDYRKWNQGQSAYSDMRNYGCLVTAQAKMLYEVGVNRASMNPDFWYEWLLRNNGLSNMYMNDLATCARYATSNGVQMEYLGNWGGTIDQIWFNINAGYYTICQLQRGGVSHYVLVDNQTSKRTGSIYVYNSYSGTQNPSPVLLSTVQSNDPWPSLVSLRVYKVNGQVTPVIDTTPPVISNVKVSTPYWGGYTVTCTVTDDVGVDRVQFPTWTTKNEQDDIFADWNTNPKASGSINGNTVTYDVRTRDHNNESGVYRTHIYAFDKAGNTTRYIVPDVTVPEYKSSRFTILNDGNTFIRQTEATVGVKIEAKSEQTIRDVSITLWKSDESSKTYGAHKDYDDHTTTATVYFNTKNDLGIDLEPGATYNYYYMYVARTAGGGGGSGTYSFTTPQSISVTGVSLNSSGLTLDSGKTQQLSATVSPSDATNKAVTWSSSNTSVATVSSTGLVTAVAAGSATITARTNDGGKTATCNVTVTEKNTAGWEQDSKGRRYRKADGSYLKNEWLTLDGKKYLFGEDGYMMTGWVQINEKDLYYLRDDGVMATGWIRYGENLYYLGPDGTMARNTWLTWEDERYYVRNNGTLASGWEKIGDAWYYLDPETTAMSTGWIESGGKWYYLNDSGVMQTGWKNIGGTEYYFEESAGSRDYGSLIEGKKRESYKHLVWEQENGYWYWYEHNVRQGVTGDN